MFEIVRKLDPNERPQIVNEDHDLFILGKQAALGSSDFSDSGPEANDAYIPIDTAGEYQPGTDMSLFFVSHLTWDLHITMILIKRGQKVVANQVLMIGMRIKDAALTAVFAPHDGEILMVDAEEKHDYKAGHIPYIMRVELPSPGLPSLQSSQDAVNGGKQATH